MLIRPPQSFKANLRGPLANFWKKEKTRNRAPAAVFSKLKKKFSFSSDSSKTAGLPAFISQFHHKQKGSRFDSDVTFDEEKPLTSTTVVHRARAGSELPGVM